MVRISHAIRQAVSMPSATSVYPVVREKLVELQRQLSLPENVVMDGRDIGTVVLRCQCQDIFNSKL